MEAAAAEPILPEEWFLATANALERFFASPDVFDKASGNFLGDFASSDACGRADMIASYLCGSPAQSKGSATAGESPGQREKPREKRRVLFTGCFDLMHAGHYNALRQAKACFPGEDVTLVAGIHSDEAILDAKGAPTVLNHAERVELARGCRWIDEIADSLPYEVPVSLLDRLQCEVAVHGDDLPKAADGSRGLFEEVMQAGRLKIVKRTEGTSTTVLIGRLLTMSKEHLTRKTPEEQELSSEKAPCALRLASATAVCSRSARSRSPSRPRAPPDHQPPPVPVWMVLPTMSRLSMFYGERRMKLGEAKNVVYVPGEWDLFHIGHTRFLEKAKEKGDFVLAGIYDDDTVHKKKGRNFPLQTLHERALNVLACKFVDDVVLAAPWQTTKDLITSLNISGVVTGTINKYATPGRNPESSSLHHDPFEYPRSTGILHIVESTCPLTMDVIADRICKRFETYTTRQLAKESAEKKYTEAKEYVAEK